MSPSSGLPKKLRRFFNEVRREAKRNPDFAMRLERALDAMTPETFIDEDDDHHEGHGAAEPSPILDEVGSSLIDVNPLAIVRRDGADALHEALHDVPISALRGLVLEHNLDPAGETDALDQDGLIAHIVRHASRRIERDKKLFEY